MLSAFPILGWTYLLSLLHLWETAEKMKNGVALTDEDRMPWLEALRDLLIDHVLRGERTVLACSALKPKYRDFLRTADFEFQPQATATSNGGATQVLQ